MGVAGDWRTTNWGTKWNSTALEIVSEDPLEFIFDTALGFPQPVFEALAREYPWLKFQCEYLEEAGSLLTSVLFHSPENVDVFGRVPATKGVYENVREPK